MGVDGVLAFAVDLDCGESLTYGVSLYRQWSFMKSSRVALFSTALE